MSEGFRGVEVHDGKVILPDVILPIGTLAAPIIQTYLDQVLMSACMSATTLELAGTIMAGLFSVRASRTITGNLRAVRIEAMALEHSVISGDVRALYVRAVARVDGEVAGEFTGAFIEMNTDAGVTLANIWAIHVGNMVVTAPSEDYTILRLDENGGATISNFLSAHIAGGSNINYFLYTAQATNAWDIVDDKTTGHTTQAGWIRCLMSGGAIKFIQLYDG